MIHTYNCLHLNQNQLLYTLYMNNNNTKTPQGLCKLCCSIMCSNISNALIAVPIKIKRTPSRTHNSRSASFDFHLTESFPHFVVPAWHISLGWICTVYGVLRSTRIAQRCLFSTDAPLYLAYKPFARIASPTESRASL